MTNIILGKTLQINTGIVEIAAEYILTILVFGVSFLVTNKITTQDIEPPANAMRSTQRCLCWIYTSATNTNGHQILPLKKRAPASGYHSQHPGIHAIQTQECVMTS